MELGRRHEPDQPEPIVSADQVTDADELIRFAEFVKETYPGAVSGVEIFMFGFFGLQDTDTPVDPAVAAYAIEKHAVAEAEAGNN